MKIDYIFESKVIHNQGNYVYEPSVPRIGDCVRVRVKEVIKLFRVAEVVWQLPCELTYYESTMGSGDVSPKLRYMVEITLIKLT